MSFDERKLKYTLAEVAAVLVKVGLYSWNPWWKFRKHLYSRNDPLWPEAERALGLLDELMIEINSRSPENLDKFYRGSKWTPEEIEILCSRRQTIVTHG